jgi:hypothetical protein
MTHISGRSEQCLESVCGIGQTGISRIALSRTTVDQGPLSTDTRLQEHRIGTTILSRPDELGEFCAAGTTWANMSRR